MKPLLEYLSTKVNKGKLIESSDFPEDPIEFNSMISFLEINGFKKEHTNFELIDWNQLQWFSKKISYNYYVVIEYKDDPNRYKIVFGKGGILTDKNQSWAIIFEKNEKNKYLECRPNMTIHHHYEEFKKLIISFFKL